MPSAPDLKKIVARLLAHYGKPKPPITTDPFELLLLENVAYLVSDDRRAEAFKLLHKNINQNAPNSPSAGSRA